MIKTGFEKNEQMKDLDKYINENADFFNSDEPEDGHFDRFKAKMGKEPRKLKEISFSLVFKIVSVAAILILSVLVTVKYNKETTKPQGNKYQEMTLSDISEEYKEVENYLKSNIDTKMEEFQNLSCSNADVSIDMVLEELEELDETYKELQEELKINKNDQRIIDAMIDCYQTKIELLNTILSQVNKNC